MYFFVTQSGKIIRSEVNLDLTLKSYRGLKRVNKRVKIKKDGILVTQNREYLREIPKRDLRLSSNPYKRVI